MTATSTAGARPRWEDEPVPRGEYVRDLIDVRAAISRLQFIVGGCAAIGTLITSLVSLLGHH